MKNIKLLFVTTIFILTTQLSADFLRAEAGVGLYNADISGEFVDTDSELSQDLNDDLKLSKDDSLYFWAYFKHPIPIVPNLRIEYLSLTHNPSSQSSFKVDEFDTILYYNFLDDTFFMTIDLGLDFKSISTSYSSSSGTTVVLAYARARVDPSDSFGIEALFKATNYLENRGYDARVKLDYTLTIVPVVQPAFEIGYRIHKLEYEMGNILNKASYSGFYGGVMIRF